MESSFTDNNYMYNLDQFIYELANSLEENPPLDEFINNLKNFSVSMEYEKDFDSICIIIDRDRESFTEKQYDLVLDICKENKYKLGITNPCFEFWLLLHLTDCKEYNVDDIVKNKKVSKNGKTFMEKCLTEKLGSYNKKRLKFQPFKHKIATAIENETIYVEDIQKLKNGIGSSIGVILKEIL